MKLTEGEFRKRRAPSFPKAPFIVSMAISRILSARIAHADDHSSHSLS